MPLRVRVVLVVAGIAISGCAAVTGELAVEPTALSDPTAPPPAAVAATSDTFNDNDVMFLQTMIVHHRQGLELAALAVDKASTREVQTLAGAIEATQRHERDTMAGWLNAWQQPTSLSADSHAEHGEVPSTDRAVFDQLYDADGETFEGLFLNAMVAHLDDAVQLTELAADGDNPQAADLAEQIATTREAQISYMLELLEGRS